MKNLFNINIFFYLLCILLIFSGFINYLIIYLFIFIVHELGHVFMIKLLGYKILKINIYPFGGIIETNINLNIKSFNLLLISLGGILFQLLLFFIVKDNGSYNYDIFFNLNKLMIIFNIFPIFPLDGSKMLLSFYERFIKYRYCLFIEFIISIISIIIISIMYKNIYMLIILYNYNIIFFMNINYYYNKFLLERYFNRNNYKKIKNINSIKDIYKNRNNCINGIFEYVYLNQYYYKYK